MSTDIKKPKEGGKTLRLVLTLFLTVSMALNITSLTTTSNSPPTWVYAQEHFTEAVRWRNLVIDLGSGLSTDAQLTLPTVGEGPYPGVLLIHGSGNMDMNEYLSPIATGLDKPTILFKQIAEYLSSRGFAVLRYNKRSVGLNGTIINMDTWGKITLQDLIQDAEKALEVLREQPEIDRSRIYIIGHSEGTMIAPRIATKDYTIAGIVLMGAAAQNLYEIVHFQIVDRPVNCAEGFDINSDGFLSIQEVEATLSYRNINLCPLPPLALIQNATGEWSWLPGFDIDADGLISIVGELKPPQESMFNLYTSPDPSSPYYWVWLQSHIALENTVLDIIGDVPASILILQGEGDTQTTVEQAFMLEQRLTESGHTDHTLITYPGLGHTFYPADGWIQPLGPMQEIVLADLHAWLTGPERKIHSLEVQIQADADRFEAALNVTRLTQTQLASELFASNALIGDLQSSLSIYTNLMYASLIIATAAIIGVILTRRSVS